MRTPPAIRVLCRLAASLAATSVALACGGFGGVDERERLHTAEREKMVADVRAALDDGRLLDAARVIGVERPWDEATFGPLAQEVASRSDDPEVLQRLGQIDAVRLDEVRLARAYGPDLAATRAARAGVTRAHGRVVLDGVVREYVTPPDRDAMLRAARDHLTRVLLCPPARDAFELRPAALGTDLDGLIDGAVEAGLPEDLAVAEVVEAALGSLDPYTRAVWPAALTGWEEHHAGVSVGVGLTLSDASDGGVVVELPVVDGPGWRGGVHAGDGVVSVGGASVAELPAPRAAAVEALLRGEPGTEVAVGVFREGARVDLTLLRAPVQEATVTGYARAADGWSLEVEPGVAVVGISAFRPHTDDELDALGVVSDRVVLDLRGNPGGDVQAALDVADRFVEGGELVRLVGRAVPPPAPGPNGELPWNQALPGHGLEGVRVVVLVDGRTASAAEILAAALRDAVGARVVGEPTFGKLVSQSLRADPVGVGWQVTTAHWTPVSGPLEHVVPDVEVRVSPAERAAIDELRHRREWPTTHPDGTPVTYLGPAARADLPPITHDIQLETAIRLATELP
ncbi:MAG: PDZ domain-containing protein [Alphaproteobacteria bacterium]|nr:PDZ domain-containing protein [Alphaproteobacteria bacterium]